MATSAACSLEAQLRAPRACRALGLTGELPDERTDLPVIRPSTNGTSWEGRVPTLFQARQDRGGEQLRDEWHQAALGLAADRVFQPWKGERSPASHASRSPGVLRSQSGGTSRVTSRRSCQRSTVEGRPQNQ